MIRRAETDRDLAGWCAVWNAITPREPTTVEDVKRRLERQPWRLYLVAEEEDIVGIGFVGPTDSPGRIALAIRVLPRRRQRGLGSQLYEQALEHARSRQPEWLSGLVSSADAEALGWVERRGDVRFRDRNFELAPPEAGGRPERGAADVYSSRSRSRSPGRSLAGSASRTSCSAQGLRRAS